MTPSRHPLSRFQSMMPLLPELAGGLVLFALLPAGGGLWWWWAAGLSLVALHRRLGGLARG